MNAKCAKCGTINTIPDNSKKFCCSSCGILNTPQPETSGTGEEACGCLLPEKFEWKLPSGQINSATGETLYTTADQLAAIRKQMDNVLASNSKIVVDADYKALSELVAKEKKSDTKKS